MTHGSLFSGIDGFSLAADWMGWQTLFTCEKDEFCNMVTKEHRNNIQYGDIKTTDFTVWRGRIDIITGGFPCQPYSVAGKRKGKDDDRHLWPEMLRAIREISPRWVVGENVRGITNWNGGLVFDEVQSDLEALGYEVQPFILPACAVNAPHRRDRVWFVAHRPDTGIESVQSGWKDGICKSEIAPDTKSAGFQTCAARQGKEQFRGGNERMGFPTDWSNFPTQSPVCDGDDGFSTGLLRQRIRRDSLGLLSEKEIDKIISKAVKKIRTESIKAGGNAVVPPLVLKIFKAIENYEKSDIHTPKTANGNQKVQ